MRSTVILCAVPLSLAGCIDDIEIVDTEPRTFTFQPSRLQVGVYRDAYTTGICYPFLLEGRVSRSIFPLWATAIPESGAEEVVIGYLSEEQRGESCHYWSHELLQGFADFDIELPPGALVTSARLDVTQTRLWDPTAALPPEDSCFWDVGAALADWSLREIESSGPPEIFFGEPEDVIAARDSYLVGPRETSVDVTNVVTRWVYGSYADYGFAFTGNRDDFTETDGACLKRLDGLSLTIEADVPAE